MKTVVVDTNIFVLLVIGLIDPNLIKSNKRTSIYTIEDFHFLLKLIGDLGKIRTSPNIWTEIDNLLNKLTLENKYKYVHIIKLIADKSHELYYENNKVIEFWEFAQIGLTDTVILKMSKNADLLISGDSSLCDIAKSQSIPVFDFKEYVNKRLLS